MKANCTKIMKSHWMVDDMAIDWRSAQSQNNKHRNRRHRVQRMLKNKWRREINRQAEEEIREIY